MDSAAIFSAVGLMQSTSLSFTSNDILANDSIRRVLMDIPDGPEGARRVMFLMKRLVIENKNSQELAVLADDITASAMGNGGYRQEAESIHDWVHGHIRF